VRTGQWEELEVALTTDGALGWILPPFLVQRHEAGQWGGDAESFPLQKVAVESRHLGIWGGLQP